MTGTFDRGDSPDGWPEKVGAGGELAPRKGTEEGLGVKEARKTFPLLPRRTLDSPESTHEKS